MYTDFRAKRLVAHPALALLIVAVVMAQVFAVSANCLGAEAHDKPAENVKCDALGDPLPPAALLRLGTSRFHAPSGVDELALSPDEKSVVTIGDEELIVWDTATAKQRWIVKPSELEVSLPGASYGTKLIAFTADGSRFYTPGPAGKIFAWNTLTGEREDLSIDVPPEGEIGQALVNGREGGYRAIEVSRDGSRLALGSASGVILISAENQGLQIGNFPKERLDINARDRLRFGGHYSLARFSPDGNTLAVVTSDTPQAIRIVSAVDAHEVRRISLNNWLVRMAFAPDGKTIVATERDSAVRLYDVQTGRRLWSKKIQLDDPSENYTSAIAFSPNGKIVAACATDEKIHLIDAENGKEVGLLEGHTWYPWTLAFTSDGKTLYSSGWDRAVRRWDVEARKQLPLPVGNWGSSVAAASPDGTMLAHEDGWGAIHLVNASDGAELRSLALAGTRYGQLAFSPDSRQLAAGGGTGPNVLIVIWDVSTGAVVHRWEWPRGRDPDSTIESIAFSPDGDRLAAAVFRQSLGYLWDTSSGKQIAELDHPEIYGLSFGPHGQLATAGWDCKLRFWDDLTGALTKEVDLQQRFPEGGELRMYTVCQAPAAGLLVTAHLHGAVRVWQLDNLAVRTKFQITNRFLFGAISVSPDGLWIATGNGNGDVEVWDSLTGAQIWNIGRHSGHVYNVSFGGDSRTLLTAGADGVAYQWDLRPPNLANDVPVEKLWDDLAGEDSKAAYDAIWQLTDQPEKAVDLLAKKLEAVTTLVDVGRITDGDSVEAKRRHQELLDQLSANKPEVQSSLVFRRAIAVLTQIGTPAARQLLEKLAARDAESDVSRLANAASKRLAHGE